MKGYVALAWEPANELAAVHIARLRRRLESDPTWSIHSDREGAMLVLERPRALTVRSLARQSGWVVGDLYGVVNFRPAPELVCFDGDGAALAEHLAQAYWGRYVAIWPLAGRLAVFRDPSGALDALRWRAHEVEIIASDVSPSWIGPLAPRLSLDWDEVANQLHEPLKTSHSVAMGGLDAIPAGALSLPMKNGARAIQIWSPASVVRRGCATKSDGAAEQLEALVDECVGAMAQRAGRFASELSGGLDSSILSAALCEVPRVAFAGCVNFHARDIESDERPAARLVSSHLGVHLTECEKPELAFTVESLASQPVGIRPSQSALDHVYEQKILEFCADRRVDTLMTGQGGDAVFLQMVTPLALLDPPGTAIGAFGRIDEAFAIARTTRQSIWKVVRSAAMEAAGFRRPQAGKTSSFLSQDRAEVATYAGHPWLENLRGVPPAKRAHIRALAYAQIAHGHSLRGRSLDIVHPLLAQPIVEYCLSLSVSTLTAGGVGRSLARRAYETRLPAATLQRRTKGDLTAHYGRALGRSVGVLRPFLLDGRLADAGLINRQALDEALSPETLIWRGDYADILHLMVMEIWARHWSRIDAPARMTA